MKKKSSFVENIDPRSLSQYAVWKVEDMDELEEGFWLLFPSIEQAIRDQPGEVVYELTPKKLGIFSIETKVVKIK